MHFHWQNLNEDRDGKVKGWAHEGRAWLRTALGAFRFEWNLWTHICGVSLKVDGEDGGLQFHWALPPVSFWLTVPLSRRLSKWAGHHGRVLLSIKIHDASLWWQFGGNDMERSSKTPKWKNGCWHPLDTFFGRTAYSAIPGGKHSVIVPMPEGGYPATVTFEDCVWRRPRLPFASHKGRYARVDVPKGIPHRGKGENSWDCGEDRLFGLSRQADTIEQAIAATVESAMRSRRKYDGNAMAVYPAPSEQAQAT